MRAAGLCALLAAGLLLLAGVDGKGGGRVRSSSSRSSSSRSSSSRSSASRTRTSTGAYRAPAQSGCRSCYYNSRTNTYSTRSYYMMYGGHYYYCYSCSNRQRTQNCDPTTCSCDEGSPCDPVDPNSMTMEVPALSGHARIMIDPAKWSSEVTDQASDISFNFSLALARDISATLGATPSGLSVVLPDAFAVVTLANTTNSWPRPRVGAIYGDLDTNQEKTIGMSPSTTPYWIDVTFTLLAMDLEAPSTFPPTGKYRTA